MKRDAERIDGWVLRVILAGLIASCWWGGTGCSSLLLHSGLELREVFSTNATVRTVEKKLGKPVALLLVTEQRAEVREPYLFPLGLGCYHDLRTVPVEGKVYRYRGFIPDYRDAASGMSLAMTLGLAEVCLFPWAIGRVARGSREVHVFEVWYDGDGNYLTFAVREGPGRAVRGD